MQCFYDWVDLGWLLIKDPFCAKCQQFRWYCFREFYGRYCEYEVRRSWCGPVRHGQWFRSDCSLCRCVQGQSICLEGAYGKCCKSSTRDTDLSYKAKYRYFPCTTPSIDTSLLPPIDTLPTCHTMHQYPSPNFPSIHFFHSGYTKHISTLLVWRQSPKHYKLPVHTTTMIPFQLQHHQITISCLSLSFSI